MDEKTFAERDIWKEFRDHTASLSTTWKSKVSSFFQTALRPKKAGIWTFGGPQRVMTVDLNKYRPGVNVEMLIDQGVRVFMLRVGGPTRWVYANWAYEVDATFVPYYERIRAYAKLKGVQVWIMGYWVHNPWSNEEGNYLGLDPQVGLFKEATRNHLCDMYSWDDEVGTCWKNNMETTITAQNLVKSISIVMEQTWNEFERWPGNIHKMVVHYSANWFMQKYAKLQYQTWLDNANKDVNTRHMMAWRAWVPTIFTLVYALIGQLFDDAITPTGTQENAYLRMGSELAADFWQLTFTAKGGWCVIVNGQPVGIDASAGYGPSATYDQMVYNANLPAGPVTPPPPGTDLEARVAILETKVTVLEGQAHSKSHTHPVGDAV